MSETKLEKYIKNNNNIIYAIIFTFLMISTFMIIYDVPYIYIMGTSILYILSILIYATIWSYTTINSKGWHKFTSTLIGGIVTILNFIVIFIPISILFQKIGSTSNLTSNYIFLLIFGSLFAIIMIIATVFLIFSVSITRMFIESRIEKYLFGWSEWDKKIIENMKEENIIDSVEYTTNGAIISAKKEFNFKDYLGLEEKFIKFSIKTEEGEKLG